MRLQRLLRLATHLHFKPVRIRDVKAAFSRANHQPATLQLRFNGWLDALIRVLAGAACAVPAVAAAVSERVPILHLMDAVNPVRSAGGVSCAHAHRPRTFVDSPQRFSYSPCAQRFG